MADSKFSGTLPLITPTEPNPLMQTLQSFGSPTPAPAALAPTPNTLTDQKRASVQDTTTAKQLALADEATLQTLAVARLNENRMAQNPIYQELRTLPYGEIVLKYGSEVARNRDRILQSEVDVDRVMMDGRSDNEVAGDTAIGVGQGVWNMAGSLGALGTGLINDQLGAYAAGLVQDGSEWMDDQKSNRFQRRMEIQGLKAQLDDIDNEAQYQEEQANPETATIGSTLRYWGRSAADEVGRVVNDPAELGNFAAENIGTLIPSTALAKGAQAAAKGSQLAGKVAVPAAVALGESGSAYVGAVNRVMEMPEEQLMESSPDYARMRSGGMTHEQALTEIATDAGMMAAALQFPVAAVAGKFVERFEAGPLSQGSLTQNLKDIGTQTIEEAVQEGTGQFNQNLGIQTFANEDQALDEGVADGAALGALGGATMAGIVKSPGIIGGAAAAGAQAAGQGLQQVVGARRSQLEAQQDAQNPVGTKNTQSNLAAVDEGLTKVLDQVSQPAAATSADPTAAPVMDAGLVELGTKIKSVALIDGNETAKMPASVRSMFLGDDVLPTDASISRGAAMFEVLKEMRGASPEVRKEAVLWLNEQVNRLGSLQGLDLSRLDDEGRAEIVRVSEAANLVMSNATVSKAVEEAQTITQADLGAMPEVTPETVSTPEVQSAISKTVALAQANPAGVDPKFIDTVLEQSTRSGTPMDAMVENQLRVAAHIARTMQGAEATKETLIQNAKEETGPGRKTVDQVREEILRSGKNNDVGQFGLDRHMSEITTAMAQGDNTKVQVLMRNLRNFAESMQNKVEAANRSIQVNDSSKNKIKYRSWTGSRWIETTEKGAKDFYVFAGSENNVLTGRAVVEDATMVANLYDGLLERLGGAVQGEPVSRVQPDQLIADASAALSVAGPEVASENVQPGRASDLPPESPEPEETAPAPERRIRKNAVVRSQESLIDESESDPVRPLAADEVSSKPAKEKKDVGARPAARATAEPEADRTPDPEAQAQEGTGSEAQTAREAGGRDEGADQTDQPSDQEEASEGGEQDGGEGGSADDVTAAPAAVVTFPNLTKTAEGISRVGRAYVFNTMRSPFLALTAPARAVMERLRDHVNGSSKLALGYAVTSEEAKTWSGILGQGGKAIMDDMNARLSQAQSGIRDGKMTPLEALANPEIDPTAWDAGKALNLVDETTGAYDPKLQQLAVMAGFHWVFNQTSNPNPKVEDVAKMFGIQDADVTDEIMDMARRGMSTRLAKESLARTILEFWGAEINKDAPMSDTLGIAQAMAIEVLVAMNGRFVFYERQADTMAQGKIKKQFFPIELSHPSTEETVKQLGHTKGLLGELMLPQAEKAYYIGDDLPPPPKTAQKRNFMGKLGQKILRVLDRHQQIEFKRNAPFLDAIKALDRDAFFELMGYEAVEDGITNRKHRKSIEGKNKQIELSWEGVMAHDARVVAKAQEMGVSPDELVSRFPWYVVSNERIHAAGFNPQSDKLMREAQVSTLSTLDMTDDAQRSLFWLTVGQSSGVIKTEGIYETESEAKWVAEFGDIHAATAGKVEALVRENFGDAVEALKNWMSSGEASLSPEDRAGFMAAVKGKGFTPKLFHALLSVARYDLANGNEIKSFQHNLSLEADGKTDGPMAAIVNWSTGSFTPGELQNQRRGGFFLAQVGQTLNDQSKKAVGDLYEVAARGTQSMLLRLQNNLKKDPDNKRILDQQHRLMRLLSAFSGDFKYDAKSREVLQVKRGLLKNPLTITIYGSGEMGIAGKVGREITDGIYAAMTRVEKMRQELADPSISLKNLPEFEGYPEIEEDLRALTTSTIIRYTDKKTGERKWGLVGKTRDGRVPMFPRNMGANFDLSPDAIEMLNGNVLQMIVKPMRAAINGVVGNSMTNLGVFQEATQLMSQVMIDRFKTEVEAAMKGRKNKSEFLSQNEYEEIFTRLSKFGAIIAPIDSQNHHLNLSASENAESAYRFTQGLDREFSGNASLAQPSDAGVSAAPLMTISRGDATMMVNYFASQDPDLRVLPVFDGLEMPADGIATISERINKAVADAWLDENGAIDMRDSFRDFMQQGLNKDEMEAASQILPQLEEIALETQARKAVMKRVNFSMDHMASGRVPYDNAGEAFDYDPAALDYDEKLAAWLNEKLEEERANLAEEATAQAAQAGVERDNPVFLDLVQEMGAAVGDMGVTRLTTRTMTRLLQEVGNRGGMTKEKMAMFQLLKTMLPEFTFLVGSRENLEAYRSHRFGVQGQALDMGQIDFRNGVIYVATGAPETVLHEMLHAVTFKLATAYYDDPSSLNEGQKVAFKNLERLMEQFMGLDFSETMEARIEEMGETITVGMAVQRQVAQHMSQGDTLSKATAINEFMAWTLTNQDLIQTLKKTRARVEQQGFLKGLVEEMVQIVRDSMKAVRKLLGLGSEASLDMYSNIAFNTGMLVYGQPNAQPGVMLEPVGTVLQQTLGQPVDLRLQGIMEAFQTKVGVHLDKVAQEGPLAQRAEEMRIYRLADSAVNRMSANFWAMDAQQKQAFRVMQAAMMTSIKFDSAALTRIEKVFAHVTGQLNAGSFIADPNNPNDAIRSEFMYEALMGGKGFELDREGRSNLMATFVALSQVHPGFRSILKSIDLPKGMKVDFSSLDDMLTTATEKAMDNLERQFSGDSRSNRNTLESMDELASVLSLVRTDEQTQVEQMASSLLDKADSGGSKLMSKGADRLSDFGDKLLLTQQAGIRGHVRSAVAQTAKTVSALMDGSRGEALATSLVSHLNNTTRVPRFMTELVNEVIGMTNENEAIYSLVNRVKYAVSKLRQEYRTETPNVIAKQFSREMTEQEWSDLHLVLGRTDVAVLAATMPMADVLKILSDEGYRKNEASRLLDEIQKKMPGVGSFYDEQAQVLARYMVTGEIDSETRVFHRNAEAIAMLLGTSLRGTNDPVMIQAIDQLTTLYAIELADKGSVDRVKELIKSEKTGVEFVAHYLVDIHGREKARNSGEVARFNAYKGYMPMEVPDGASLIVADDADNKVLTSKGYTRIGAYKGTGLEKGSKGYYYSAVSGRNTFSQGIMQTVQASAFGVDPRTGFTVNGTTGGVIQGRAVPYLEKQLGTVSKLGKEVLMPVFDAQGNVVAYERSLDPVMLERLRRNTNIGEMLGAWAGRQTEEELGQQFNRTLVDRTHKIYREATGRRGEFVNLADSKLTDPILKDAWDMVPKETKEYIESKFGRGEFWVRKDMVNATLGYRMPSVSDFWSGLSRLSPEAQKSFVDAATMVFGKNTFRYLVTAEKGWQTAISTAKHIIVVSSVIVPVSNFLSNFMQLTLNGVPLRSIVKGMGGKLVEIDQHLKHLDRKVEIRALMARYRDDRTMMRRLETELQSLDDADKRMSIWPLIEAGEFSTISEGLTDMDNALTEGRWADRMAQLMERVPRKFGTVGRYAVITRDTALFKGMSRATQYGDFLARGVLYDHLVSQGKTREEALRRITEEFVNYNFLPGRQMSYAESMGMIWFSAYKLRSMKVALNHIRNNPVRALLLNANPLGVNIPGLDVGSPITDNLASVIADDRLGYSIGPGMLFRAPEMNPWMNLIN